MTNILTFFAECWKAARERTAAAKRKQRLYRVALAFNDLHTHTSRSGRWMCPTCNDVHDALPEVSVWSGLQYPACCEFPQDHRLHHKWHATTGNTRRDR